MSGLLGSDAGIVCAVLLLVAAAALTGFALGVVWAQRREARRMRRINAAVQGKLRELPALSRRPGERFEAILKRHAREASR